MWNGSSNCLEELILASSLYGIMVVGQYCTERVRLLNHRGRFDVLYRENFISIEKRSRLEVDI
jgi:hypothetical protein